MRSQHERHAPARDDTVQATRARTRVTLTEAPRACVPDSGPMSGEPGRPLDRDTRSLMEGAFGRGFSHVRVHAGAAASASARALGARAYALGSNVAFAEGRYQPATAAGRALVAHELAHVVQHERAPEHGDKAEERARAAGDTIATGGTVDPASLGGPPVGIARQAEPSLTGTRPGGPRFGLEPATGTRGLALTLSSVTGFGHDDAAVPTPAAGALDAVAGQLFGLLTQLPAGRVMLTGHTDLTGGEKYNETLGRKRALNVWVELVRRGLPAGSIDVESAGISAPVVATTKPEPRNRRVEVRFQGHLLPEAASRFGLGDLQRPAISPGHLDPSRLTPGAGALAQRQGALAPPFATPPRAAPQPSGREGPTKGASAGDALKALLKTEPGRRALDALKAEGKHAWDKTTTGEKVAGAATALAIVAPTVAGIWSDPSARATALKVLDGAEVDVPEVPGLKVRAVTSGQGGGAVLIFDLSKVVGALQ